MLLQDALASRLGDPPGPGVGEVPAGDLAVLEVEARQFGGSGRRLEECGGPAGRRQGGEGQGPSDRRGKTSDHRVSLWVVSIEVVGDSPTAPRVLERRGGRTPAATR